MTKGRSLLQSLLTMAMLAFCASATAQARTALVIGNSAYANAPLVNPRNDASDVAASLRGAGFDVDLKLDADRKTIQAAIGAFAARLKAKGGAGLFYFAGHGAQLAGENYLMPVDVAFGSLDELKRSAVSAGAAVDAMAKARDGLNIVILDACRNNPLPAAAGTAGLSRIDTNASLFMSFATSPGAVALDGAGRNSPYTKHLVQAIGTDGLSIEETFKRTLKGVYQETRGTQTPWLSSSFFGDFVFRPRGAQAALRDRIEGVVSEKAVARMASLGGIYRETGTNPSGSQYVGMAAIEPRGDQVRFTWWIAKDRFIGNGEMAGQMLIVKWNQTHPVVYTFEGEGLLQGEWADGTASDRLELFAPLDSAPAPAPGGQYTTDGMNPNGKLYSGTVSIVRRGEQYQFAWKTGPSSYSGTGRRQGNLMIVDWGSTMPMLYALNSDGTLSGLWDAGRGHETLTPVR
jgi:uncharacterized caspase-like protein